jgi:hypothetical protein
MTVFGNTPACLLPDFLENDPITLRRKILLVFRLEIQILVQKIDFPPITVLCCALHASSLR